MRTDVPVKSPFESELASRKARVLSDEYTKISWCKEFDPSTDHMGSLIKGVIIHNQRSILPTNNPDEVVAFAFTPNGAYREFHGKVICK